MAIFNGNIHYKWPFSIATLNYQRVTPSDQRSLSLPSATPVLGMEFLAKRRDGAEPQQVFQVKPMWPNMAQHSLDWFKGKSTGNHGFYHQI